VADLTERYQNNQRQKCLSDSFVPSHNFKFKGHQWRGGLATQPPLDLPLVWSNSVTMDTVKNKKTAHYNKVLIH